MKYVKDAKVRKAASKDWSGYEIMPKLVAYPRSEKDVHQIVADARKKNLSITPRGGATGMSGAALGKGIVVDFRHLNKIKKVGKTTRVQAGCFLKRLRPVILRRGYMLPGVPLHGDCMIGGCVNTNSVGPMSLKYGMVDSQVKSLRCVIPDGRLIDTSKEVPMDLTRKIARLKTTIQKDNSLFKYIMSRPAAAGGYNLRALFDYKDIRDVFTHLLVGSVGTLALITEVELVLPKRKPIEDLYVLYFSDLKQLGDALPKILEMKPTTIEFADEVLLNVWKEYDYIGAHYALIVSFEQKSDIPDLDIVMRRIAEKEYKKLWDTRRDSVKMLGKMAKKMGRTIPAGFEDVTFHVKDSIRVIRDIQAYCAKRKLIACIYGHIGVGSLHIRAFLDMKKDPKQYISLGKDLFTIVSKYGGTMVGEHNAGRNRSHFLAMENKKMYAAMHALKRMLDPMNILNPNVMFDLEPILEDFKPKV